jgi:hypothetical protein
MDFTKLGELMARVLGKVNHRLDGDNLSIRGVWKTEFFRTWERIFGSVYFIKVSVSVGISTGKLRLPIKRDYFRSLNLVIVISRDRDSIFIFRRCLTTGAWRIYKIVSVPSRSLYRDFLTLRKHYSGPRMSF